MPDRVAGWPIPDIAEVARSQAAGRHSEGALPSRSGDTPGEEGSKRDSRRGRIPIQRTRNHSDRKGAGLHSCSPAACRYPRLRPRLSLFDARFRTGAEVDIVNRRFCIQISGLTIVAALTAPVRLAGADLTPTVRIVLQVPVRSSVPLHLVIRAKDEMTRIYQDAGVTVSWIDPASAASQRDPIESPAAMRPTFGLVVLPEEVAERLTVAPDALGGAVGTRDSDGRLAYVFYDRVARIAVPT